MDSLLFSFNATVPVFLMMVLGMLLRKLGWMSEEFASQLNRFVFMLPLPVLLFQDLATVDFLEVWHFSFVAFCFNASTAFPMATPTSQYSIISISFNPSPKAYVC